MFFTTNYLDKIPKNMMRPGRIDMVIEIGYANKDQFIDMINDFYKNDDKIKKEKLIELLCNSKKDLTIAILQDYFIRFREIDEAIVNIEELL
jgi:chaperone BCS1